MKRRTGETLIFCKLPFWPLEPNPLHGVAEDVKNGVFLRQCLMHLSKQHCMTVRLVLQHVCGRSFVMSLQFFASRCLD